MAERKIPNILLTGTPGVGKTTIAKEIEKQTCLEYLNVGDIAKEKNCFLTYCDEYQCPILDEEKLLTNLKSIVKNGGRIIEYHSCDFFPNNWFDVVYVLRTDNTVLYDRLLARGYDGKKLTDNIECEIFQMILEEAQSTFDSNIVYEFQNNTENDKTTIINAILEWIRNWNEKKKK